MRRKVLSVAVAGIATLLTALSVNVASALSGVKDALKEESFAFLRADSFRLRIGQGLDCAVPKQNLWYFEDELIAVPASEKALAGLSKGTDRNKRQWGC